jgi:RNA polymerase sigma-70 factor (ECF subfamily)
VTADLLPSLLRTARKGDEEAFRRLVEATRDRLFWTVRRMVGRDALSEEILQDAYMALWGLPEASLPRDVQAWLRRFCVNRSIDHLRREETKRVVDTEAPLDFVASSANPEHSVSGIEVEEAVGRALATLPSQEKAAFVLKVIEGMDYPEVSSLLGVAESTARNQVMQARRKLEKALRSAGVEL